MFPFMFPHGSIKIAYLASVPFAQLGVGHMHDLLKRVVVTEEATLFCGENLFRAQIASTVDGKHRRGPLLEEKGTLPYKYNCGGALFPGGIKRGARGCGVGRWGACYASRIAGGAAFRKLCPTSFLSLRGTKFRARGVEALA